MQQKKSKMHVSKPIAILSVVIVLVLGLLIFLFTSPTTSFFNPLNARQQQPPTPSPDPLKPLNIAIIGYAGANHDGGSLTDTIILAHINPKTQTTHLISVPRDTWIDLPTSKEASTSSKINAAYAIGKDDARYPNKPQPYTGKDGGGYMLKNALYQVTGLKPDYFIAVNFEGFIQSLSLLGNITINVPYSFDDYFYPIAGKEKDPCGKTDEEIASLTATMSAHLLEKEFPCRYEHISFTQGPSQLTATQALKFVRSRHSAVGGSDFGRSQRQQALITAVKDKVFSLNTLTQSVPLITQAAKHFHTDLDLEAAKNFLTVFDQAPSFPISSITLSTDNVFIESKSQDGQYILIPKKDPSNFSSIHQYIQSQLASNSATISPVPTSNQN